MPVVSKVCTTLYPVSPPVAREGAHEKKGEDGGAQGTMRIKSAAVLIFLLSILINQYEYSSYFRECMLKYLTV